MFSRIEWTGAGIERNDLSKNGVKTMKEYGDFISEEDRMTIAAIGDFVREEIVPVRQQLDEDEDRKLVHLVLDGLAEMGLHKRGYAWWECHHRMHRVRRVPPVPCASHRRARAPELAQRSTAPPTHTNPPLRITIGLDVRRVACSMQGFIVCRV